MSPTLSVDETRLDVHEDDSGEVYFIERGKRRYLGGVLPFDEASLYPTRLDVSAASGVTQELVWREEEGERSYYRLDLRSHFAHWSLLPALVAIVLCWVTKEPITSLLGGVVAGALVLGRYDLTGEVLVSSLSTTAAASILILYLWMLGGLLGVWSKSGGAQAFAEFMARRFVTGPRSAKLVAWGLGIVFFQGGTVSTVLVGTTVKPLADDQNVSHEELSYIVDSTASPIASQLAFNAWPGYIQAFIYVSGVSFSRRRQTVSCFSSRACPSASMRSSRYLAPFS